MVMEQVQGWRSVMVAPPDPLAAIGGALRRAFPVDGAARKLDAYTLLLSRLDRR